MSSVTESKQKHKNLHQMRSQLQSQSQSVPNTSSSSQSQSQPQPQPITNGSTTTSPASGFANPDSNGNDESKEIPLLKAGQQFKLISVDFKEAALDSPSFRALVNHLDTQVDNIEKWLLAIVSTIGKFPRYVTELKTFSDSFLEHLLPTFLQDGLIEQEYTIQSLETVTRGMSKMWDMALSALTVDTQVLEILKMVVHGDIKKYKRLRKKFEYLQAKYDRYLSIYQSTPKLKEPGIVREDAFQLFEVRKDYIHCCIDLSIQLTELGNALDKVFVKLASELWNNKHQVFEKFDATSRSYQELMFKIKRIQSWCDLNVIATQKLLGDMTTARLQVENSTQLQFKPSPNLEDYNAGTINNHKLQDIEEPATEKHGYLFMKTWKRRRYHKRRTNTSNNEDVIASGTSSNTGSSDSGDLPIWVKRWAFIKGGVFGLLNLSPSNTFVQESDKIGLLVCNIKYTPSEDRRNCFELKTIDSTYIFQAETLLELKSWLKVFENEKNRILQENDNALLNIASGRYPPILKELSNTINTVTDRLLTSSKIINQAGQIIAPLKLSTHIEKNEKEFQKYVYYQLLQIRPPFITDSTKSSILAYSLVDATSLPTALTANIWGSINWGIYYLHDAASSYPTKAADEEPITPTKNILKPIYDVYPKKYPSALLPKDIQMRALFETAVEPGEYCLLSFRAIWSPNSRQELGGRCFVTNNHIYVYMNALGFIALFKGRLDKLVSVDYSAQEEFDLLRIFNLNGVIKMKLFLDDAATICKKFAYLISNQVKDTPETSEQLIDRMGEIDQQRKAELLEQSLLPTNFGKEAFPLVNSSNVSKSTPNSAVNTNTNNNPKQDSFVTIPANEVKTRAYTIDFRDEARLLASSSYSIPPKAIFHALLGDDSILLSQITSFSRIKSINKKPWNTDPATGKLFRKMNAESTGNDSSVYRLQFQQRIDNMDNDEYFNFTHTKSKFRFPLGGTFKLTYRIVIYGESRGRSRVLIYGDPVFDKPLRIIAALAKYAYIRICIEEAKTILSMIRDSERAIGTHGMVTKSIYLYGKLTKSTYPVDDVPDVPVTKFTTSSVLVLLLHRLFVITFGWTSHFLDFVGSLLVNFYNAIKMNQLLIGLLIISTIFNVFLAGRSTSSYWTVRRVSKMANEFVTSDPWAILKAIYLKDTEDMLRSNLVPTHLQGNSTDNSRCFETFKDISFSLNYDRTSRWTADYGDAKTREIAKGLKKSIQEIAIKRNELLIQLNTLNKMEEEVSKGEWNNWLMSEIQRCDFITNEVLAGESELKALEIGTESIIEYCNSCYKEVKHIGLI